MRDVRVFVSSPSDCAPERQALREVVARLGVDPLLASRFRLTVFDWETPHAHLPYPATLVPQDAALRGLKPPESCDLFILIFRERFGTPLTTEAFRKADGSPYLSGSEYEFERARTAADRTNGRQPGILVYRATPQDPPADPVQRGRLDTFFASHWFRDPQGALRGGVHTFADAASFAAQLEQHLRGFLAELVPWLRESTQGWLEANLARLTASAGPRYTPEAHVNTAVERAFDCLLRRPAAWKFLDDALSKVNERLIQAHVDALQPFHAEMGAIAEIMRRGTQASPAELREIRQKLEALLAAVHHANDNLERPRNPLDPAARHLAETKFERVRRLGTATSDALEILLDLSNYAEKRVLLLSGPAGNGKTHTLVAQVRQEIARGGVALGVLGRLPAGQLLWRSIWEVWGAGNVGSPEEFVRELDHEARRRGTIALLAFDALNETLPRSRWQNELPAMLAAVRPFEHVAVVLAVRDDYAAATLPAYEPGAAPWQEASARGFAGVEGEALATFFRQYDLEAPVAPPVVPELANPLYLKLLCTSMHGRGRLPGNLPSWLEVRDALVQHLEREALQDPELDLDARRPQHVRRALQRLSELILASTDLAVPWREAELAVEGLGLPARLVSFLVSSDVLYEVPGGTGDDNLTFAYERLSDTFLADQALRRETSGGGTTSAEAVRAAFAGEGLLGRLVTNRPDNPGNQIGLLKVLALLVPKATGTELVDLLPANVPLARIPIARAFWDSLLWRNQASEFGGTARELMERLEQWVPQGQSRIQQVDHLIRLAAMPGHPLRAEVVLHPWLRSFPSLGTRDSEWSLPLVPLWQDSTSGLRLLVDWAAAWDLAGLAEETALQAGLILAWATSAPNTGLGEQATKGLCRVLRACPGITLALWQYLQDVDDPWVIEALLDATLGSIQGATDRAQAAAVARHVYERMFGGRGVARYCHLQIRDIARRIVESAHRQGLLPDVDPADVAPPYRSHLDLDHLPSFDDFLAMSSATSWRALVGSCGPGGDFYRYVLRENSARFPFSARPLPGSTEPARPFDAASHGGLFQRQAAKMFDIDLVARYILATCLELGWKAELHHAFDSGPLIDRERIINGPKTERIGKKYQWIGWATALAFLADNYGVLPDGIPYDVPGDLDLERSDPSRWLISPAGKGQAKVYLTPSLETKIEGGDPSTPLPPAPWPEPAPADLSAWLRRTDSLPSFATVVNAVPATLPASAEERWLRVTADLTWHLAWRPGRWVAPELHARMWWQGLARVIRQADLPKLHQALTRPDTPNAFNQINMAGYPGAGADTTLDAWQAGALRGDDVNPALLGFVDLADPKDGTSDYFPVPYAPLFGSLGTESTVTLPTPWVIGTWDLRLDERRAAFVLPDGRTLFVCGGLAGGQDLVFAPTLALADALQARGLALVWLVVGEQSAYLVDTDYNRYRQITGIAWLEMNGTVNFTPVLQEE